MTTLTAWALSLCAQDPQDDPYAWIDRFVQRIAERAELTEDQKKAMAAELRELQKKTDELRKETVAKLKEALGEEKYKQLEGSLGRFFGRSDRPERGGPPWRGGWEGIGERTRGKLKEELGLSEEQFQRLQELQQEFQKKTGDMFRDAGREGLGEAVKKYREEYQGLLEKMKEGLSDEQKEKFDKIVKESGREEGPGRFSSEAIEKMMERLKDHLSDEQRENLERILKGLRGREEDKPKDK